MDESAIGSGVRMARVVAWQLQLSVATTLRKRSDAAAVVGQAATP